LPLIVFLKRLILTRAIKTPVFLNMRKYSLILILCLQTLFCLAQQKVMTEGSLTYSITVATTNKEAEMADIFDGATLNVFIKGTVVSSELKSVLLNQTIVYDGKTEGAVIIKEAGDQKFITSLSPANWLHFNRKYEGVSYTFQDETKTILGYPCKKANGKLKDGTEFTVFYATNLSPNVKGYDYQFKSLPGLPLEYEVQNGNMKVKYTASKILFAPVPAFKFEIPQKGYRILDYQQ